MTRSSFIGIRRRPAAPILLVCLMAALAACAAAAPTPAPVVLPSPVPSAGPTPAPATPTAAPTGTPAAAATRPPPTPTAVKPPPASPTAPLPTQAAIAVRPESVRLQLKPVASGLESPLFVTHAAGREATGRGRLFIVEKTGAIRIWADGRLLDKPFLDLRGRVRSTGSEQGLLGLAFPPDYARSGDFFVNYTDQGGNTVVARFSVTTDPDVADPASEFKVLGLAQPAANHNGGMLAFGPDGYLYIGTGDGGGANDTYGNGQNPRTLLGKMLRLDVTSDRIRPYVIPADNPWVKSAWNGQDVRDEVWAMGLRNPWRYSFDRATGDLWIADVGQNRYEEVDLVLAGEGKVLTGGLNFGWPLMEGVHCFPETAACQTTGLVLPVAEYEHAEGNCSVTGGHVYRGRQSPTLTGLYLYGDYCSGVIWALGRGSDGRWQSYRLLDSKLGLSSFGEDEAGELYVTDLRGGGVYQVVGQ